MKFNLKSRKFIAWIVGMIVLILAMVFIAFKAPDQVGAFAPWFIVGLIFLTALFVGGTVWADFVKSKYFRSELNNGPRAPGEGQ